MPLKYRRLRLALLGGVAVAFTSAIGTGVAQAVPTTPITYQLNTIISDNTLTKAASSYGTVTYTNNGNHVDPTDFNFATAGGLFIAVLIDCDPIWVGNRADPVPEPASIAVLGLGLAALGILRNRKI